MACDPSPFDQLHTYKTTAHAEWLTMIYVVDSPSSQIGYSFDSRGSNLH
jgi:hypothetical protein